MFMSSIATSPQRSDHVRQVLAILFTLIACALMTVTTYYFRPGTEGLYIAEGSLSFLLGGIAFGIALLLTRNNLPTFRPTSEALTPSNTRWWMVGLGIIALAILAEANGRMFSITELDNLTDHLQFGLLVTGICLVGWGFAGKIQPRISISDRWTFLLVCAITLLGFALRIWKLDTGARFMQDEIVFTDALTFFWTEQEPLILNGGGFYTITLLYSYWNSLTVGIFGRNLIGLRIPSVVIGVLGIPVVYGLAKTLFNKHVGLLAALFVATFPPHMHFSQISWGHMGDALFGTMALLFLIRGLNWNRRTDWTVAGVSLGLTQYFYEVGRLFYPPTIIVWFVLLFLGWKMKPYRHGFLMTLLVALLIAAPVFYSIYARHNLFAPRLNDSAASSLYWNEVLKDGLTENALGLLIGRARIPLLVYIQHPDSLAEYYGGFGGFVSSPLVPLLLLGVIYVLWRIRYPVFVLLLLPLVVSAANIFANDPGLAPRYAILSPILPIIMAIGLYSTLQILMLNRRWVVVTLAILISLWQVYFYFELHLPYYNIQRRQMSSERDIFDAVLRTVDLPLDTITYLIEPTGFFDRGRAEGLYNFLKTHPESLQSPVPEEFDPSSLPRNQNYAFFVAPGDTETQNKILAAFPHIAPPTYTTWPIPAWDEYILYYWESPLN